MSFELEGGNVIAPVSYQQEGVWFHAMNHITSYWNFTEKKFFNGRVNIRAIKRSLEHIVNRHAALRTNFLVRDEKLVQVIRPRIRVDDIFYELHFALSDDEVIAGVSQRELDFEENFEFDLETSNLIRFKVLQFETSCVFILTVNHIITDSVSMGIFWNELSAGYNASEQDKNGAPQVTQYMEYCREQNRFYNSEHANTLQQYWLNKQEWQLPALNLNFHTPGVKAKITYKEVLLPDNLFSDIRSFALRKKLLPSSIFLTAYFILLFKYTNQLRIVICSILNGRKFNNKNYQSVFGLFANRMLGIQELKESDSLFTIINNVNAEFQEGIAKSDMIYDRLLREVRRQSNTGLIPLFSAVFNMVKDRNELVRFDGLSETDHLKLQNSLIGDIQSDIGITVSENGKVAKLRVDLKTGDQMTPLSEFLVQNYLLIVSSCITRPDMLLRELKIVSSQEQSILEGFNATGTDFPRNQTVIDLFRAQADRRGSSVALVYGEETLSYKELDERSNQLAHYLHSAGVQSGSLVGICLERSLGMVTGILGIMKAGAAYVPIDPEYPHERISYMLDGIGSHVLLCSSSGIMSVPLQYWEKAINIDQDWEIISRQSTAPLPTSPGVHDLAYVIYTSGSTGRPKGVMIEHLGLVNRLTWTQNYFNLVPQDCVLQKTTFCFDVSVWELLWPLIAGCRLIMAEPGSQRDNDHLKFLIAKHSVTTIHFVPSMLEAFLHELKAGELLTLKNVLCSGEALKPYHVQLFRDRLSHAVLHNLYGPTEASIDVTCWSVPVSEEKITVVPIGKPIANTTMYVLDDYLQPAPIGAPGELYIGGIGLARGYLNRPDLTAEKFIAHPFHAGALLYRSGDLARWLPDGNIEYLGRRDDQVKIRGYRIELGEIETVVQQSGYVKQNVVIAHEDAHGARRLVGYAVSEGVLQRDKLVGYLQEYLPDYMIPQLWMALDSIPVTSNGKLDKRSLPQVDAGRLQDTEYIAPRTEIEHALSEIWREVLGVERIGIHDNFFSLGGDSIITIQIASRCKRLGYSLRPRDIFSCQTVSQLSSYLSGHGTEHLHSEQGRLSGESKLLPIQQRYFERVLSDASISHYNQSVFLRLNKQITTESVEQAFNKIIQQHDALRFVYSDEAGNWKQYYSHGNFQLNECDLRSSAADTFEDTLSGKVNFYQKSLDIRSGKLIRVILFHTPAGIAHNRLLIIIHHLAVDGVSWRILLEDLQSILKHQETGIAFEFGAKSSSYREWYNALQAYSTHPRLLSQQSYWEKTVASHSALPVDRKHNEPVPAKDWNEVRVNLSADQTAQLLQVVPRAYQTEINDILLSALAETLAAWSGNDQTVIALEGHGREEQITETIDLSHTVGWFTTVYPFLLEAKTSRQALIRNTKEKLRQLPDRGLGYGVLKYISENPAFSGPDPWEIVFNYLGQFGNSTRNNHLFSKEDEHIGTQSGEDQVSYEKLSLNSIIADGELVFFWGYSIRHYNRATVEYLCESYLNSLQKLIAHCVAQKTTHHTPSDYGLGKEINFQQMDEFLQKNPSITSFCRLSALQEGMLFHSLYDSGVKAYIEQFACDLSNVKKELLIDSWYQLVRRHTILRSGFYHDAFAIPVQCVYDEVVIPIKEMDYRAMDTQTRCQAIVSCEERDREQGFDFSETPLMRLSLIRIGESDYRMIFTCHHILLDGWSLAVLLAELKETYSLLSSGMHLPAAEDNYSDFIRFIEARDRYKEEAYWKNYLADIANPVLLPFVNGAKDRTKGFGGYCSNTLIIDSEWSSKLGNFARSNKLTVNTIMQGVWSYLLHRYTGHDHVIFGITVSGRPEELDNIEQRVGMYINTLPCYTYIKRDACILRWLEELQQDQIAGRQYQYVGLNEIQKWIGIRGDLFDTLFVFENYPVSNPEILPGNDFHLLSPKMQEQTNYPLTIIVDDSKNAASVVFTYNTELVEEAFITSIKSQFDHVLKQLITAKQAMKIEDLCLLNASQEQSILEGFNATGADFPRNQTIIDLFRAQADRRGSSVALVYGEKTLSYKELDERSNQLAHYLHSSGVQSGSLVGICLERSLGMVTGILGIMKAGAAYVPIDPEYPHERISYMLDGIGSHVLLCSSSGIMSVPPQYREKAINIDQDWEIISRQSTAPLPTSPGVHDLAYVIYTSGSTGRPKGVMIEHLGLVNRLTWTQNYFNLVPQDCVLQKTTFCFDVSVWELLWPLIAGCRLIMAEPGSQRDNDHLKFLIAKHSVTTIHFVPSMLEAFLHELKAGELLTLKNVLCSGEALKPYHVQLFRDRLSHAVLHNLYGPTEASIDVTCWSVPVSEEKITVVPIGKPIANTTMYVLDDYLQPAPIGAPGELYIGGIGLARGYLNRPDLTAEKFIAHPFHAGALLYRSGDLARWLPDGNIEYLGRRDDQVKIRGYRIELGEIETVVQQSGYVKQNVVIAHEDAHGARRLVGYAVSEGVLQRDKLVGYLQEYLPDYMIPQLWMALDSIPVTSNGKLDKRSLPQVDAGRLQDTEYIAPRTEIEHALSEIWREVLGVERIGIHDNFFSLGGDSLLAMKLNSHLVRKMKARLPVRVIFESPVLMEFASYVEVVHANNSLLHEETSYEVIDLE